MVINVANSLLIKIKDELSRFLEKAEGDFSDVIEYKDARSAEVVSSRLRSVRDTLILLDEKLAAELCDKIILSVGLSLKTSRTDEALANAFLSLADFVRCLADDPGTKDIEQSILSLQVAKFDFDTEKQESLVRIQAALELIINDSSKSADFWKHAYKITNELKLLVNTKEIYEYVWLVQQLSSREIKGDITHPSGRKFFVEKLLGVVRSLLKKGETITAYLEIDGESDKLSSLLGLNNETIRNDYKPPKNRLIVDSDGLVLTYAVSSETIEIIAFIIRRELALTRSLIEDVFNDSEARSTEKVALIKDSLAGTRAAFQVLGYQSGCDLIDESNQLIDQFQLTGEIDQLSQNVILIENSLWGLKYQSNSHIVNKYDKKLVNEKEHYVSMLITATESIVGSVAYDLFKSLHDEVIENFGKEVPLDTLLVAEKIHRNFSIFSMLQNEKISKELKQTELCFLYLNNHQELLSQKEVIKLLIDLLVFYEVLLDQYKASLFVDERALKLLSAAQKRFVSAIKFNIENISVPTYLSHVTNEELEDIVLSDDLVEETQQPEKEELEDMPDVADVTAASDSAQESNEQEGGILGYESGLEIGVARKGSEAFFTEFDVTKVPIDETIHSMNVDKIDEEFLEIFLEESKGIIQDFKEQLPLLENDYYNSDAIVSIRRGFHTLKGSGRMVGLSVIGEFSWQHEDLLNKVIANSFEFGESIYKQLENSLLVIEASIFSEPFSEDRGLLLREAAIANALKNALLGKKSELDHSGVYGTDQKESKDQVSEDQVSEDQVSEDQVSEDQVSEDQVSEDQVSEDQVSEDQVSEDQVSEDQVSEVKHDDVPQEETDSSKNNSILQNIAQTADMIANSGAAEVEPKDIKAVLSALNALDDSALSKAQKQIMDDLRYIRDSLDKQNWGSLPSEKAIHDIAQAIDSAASGLPLPDSSLEEIKKHIDDDSSLLSNQQILDYLSLAEESSEQSKRKFDLWRDVGFSFDEEFFDLKQNIQKTERLASKAKSKSITSVSHKANNVLTLLNDNRVEDIPADVVLSLETAVSSVSDILKEVKSGNKSATIDQSILNHLDFAINDLNRNYQQIKEKASHANDGLSIDADINAQLKSGSGVQSDTLDPLSLVGQFSDQISTFDKSDDTYASHENLIELLYELESSLDEKEAPEWVWEMLSTLEDVLRGMQKSAIQPDDSDQIKINDALDKIISSESVSKEEAKKTINDLMNLRAGLGARKSAIEQTDISDENLSETDQSFAETSQDQISSEEGLDHSTKLREKFAGLAPEHVENSKSHFSEWEESEFVDKVPLHGLQSSVQGITKAAKETSFSDAELLGESVGSVLERIDGEDIKPYPAVTDDIEKSIHEFEHSIEAIKSGERGDISDNVLQNISSQVVADDLGEESYQLELESIQVEQESVNDTSAVEDQTPSDDSLLDDALDQQQGAAIDDSDKGEGLDVDPDLLDAIVEAVNKRSTPLRKDLFISQAPQHIDDSKSHFNDWKASDYEEREKLQDLRGSVGEVSEIAKDSGFEDAEILTDSVGSILDQIFLDNLKPNDWTASNIDNALDELHQSASSMKLGGDGEIPRETVEISMSLARSASVKLGSPIVNNYQITGGVSIAENKPPVGIDTLKDALSTWEENDYQANSSLENLRSHVKDIAAIARENDLVDTDELTKIINELLAYIDAAEKEPSAENTANINSALNRLDQLIPSIQLDEADLLDSLMAKEDSLELSDTDKLDREAEDNESLTPSDLIVEAQSEIESGLDDEAQEEESLVDPIDQSKQKFADSASTYIDNSKAHLSEWEMSDYIEQEPLNNLKGSVGQLTDIAKETEFTEAESLTKSVEEILEAVSSEELIPYKETVSSVEGALDALKQSVASIESGGDGAISEDVMSQVLATALDKDNLGQKVAENQDKSEDLELSDQVIEDQVEIDFNLDDEAQEESLVDPVDQSKQKFAESASIHINGSKYHLSEWEAGDYIEQRPLNNLRNCFTQLTNIAKGAEFMEAEVLTASVEGILSTILSEELIPYERTASSVENVLDELEHSVSSIEAGGDGAISKDLISQVLAIASDKENLGQKTVESQEHELEDLALGGQAIEVQSELTTKEVTESATVEVEASSVQVRRVFSKLAPTYINDSKSHLSDWEASNYVEQEPLNNLRGSVGQLTGIARESEFTEAEALTTSVGGILDTVAYEELIPHKDTVSSIEGALDELDHSVSSIETGGDGAISKDVISQVLTIASRSLEYIGSKSSIQNIPEDQLGLATEELPETELTEIVSPVQVREVFSKLAPTHIDDSRSHLSDWGESDYVEREPLNNLRDSVGELTDLAKETEFTEAEELTTSVEDILDTVSSEELVPHEETISSVEGALDELDHSVSSIESGGDGAISREVIYQVSSTAESLPENLGSSVSYHVMAPSDHSAPPIESDAEITPQVSETETEVKLEDEASLSSVVSQSKQNFAEFAPKYIDNSKFHLSEWRESDYTETGALKDLRGSFGALTTTANEYNFIEAETLTSSVGNLLDRIFEENLVPHEETVSHVDDALTALDDSVSSIKSGGDGEIPEKLSKAILKRTSQMPDKIGVMRQNNTRSIFDDFDQTQDEVKIGGADENESVQPLENVKFNDPSALDDTILEIFLDEAKDILAKTQKSLEEWKEDYNDLSALHEIQRGMHTIKGGSRMAELTIFGDLAHHVESLLDLLVEGSIQNKDGAYEILKLGHQESENIIAAVSVGRTIYENVDFLEKFSEFIKAETGKGIITAVPAPESAAIGLSKKPASLYKKPEKHNYSIRVQSSLIEGVANLVGESAISRSRIERNTTEHGFQLDELSRTIERVAEQLRRLDNETEAQILFKRDSFPTEDNFAVVSPESERFDPLELDRFSEIQQLSRSLSETVDDLKNIGAALYSNIDSSRFLLREQKNINRELQSKILSATLVRFDSIQPRIERIISQVSSEIGKEVDLQIYGGQVEIERNMLEDLLPGFEHTIRNSLAHGIELPSVREQSGKPREGRIRIGIRREGAEIWFVIADDGRGADHQKIIAKARKMGILDESLVDDHGYLLQLLFEQRFTTAAQTTQLSGRGIGLDVLKDAVVQRQGHIDIESEKNKGLAISIRMPFTLSVTEALITKIGRYTYAVPIMSVEGVSRVNLADYDRFKDGETIRHLYGQKKYTLASLIDYFDPHAERVLSQYGVPVLLIRVGGSRIALEVEDILDRQELIVKPVNEQIQAIEGIVGAAVLDDGLPVPVLEVATVARQIIYYMKNNISIKDKVEKVDLAKKNKNRTTSILVVDDSITMRKVTASILGRYDVETKTAKDGVDAIDVISEWTPDLILLDIEMPRMDGFEFATHIRNDDFLSDVPIIMITSRTGEKHRQRAESIGVQGYLGKPYTEEILTDAIEKVLKTTLKDI